jgi:RNA polymerase sigma-32 factor
MENQNVIDGAHNPRVDRRGNPSSLALRIRRAAQMASRAKAKAAARKPVVAEGAAPGTPAAPAKPKRARTDARAGTGDATTAFQRYLRSLQTADVLPPEEERALAHQYRDNNDAQAASRLVRGNLRLVVKIAEEYGRSEDQLMDLIQEGNLGLMHALEKFDPGRGVKLSSYAAWWIRAYILKFLLANFRVVRLGTTLAQRKLFYKLRRERERLERAGVEVNAQQLATALEVRPADVTEMELRLASPEVSLDSPVRNEGARPPGSSSYVPADPGGRPDAQLEEGEFRQLLRETVARFGESLQGRERQIFLDRLVSEEPLTLQEIGRRYGVSRERARQLESRLKERMRLYLESEFADPDVLSEAA